MSWRRRRSLEITPLSGFSAAATAGGPVKVVSQSFLLTNAGTTALNWTLANPAAWLSNSASGGTLAAGGFTNVTVSLDAGRRRRPACRRLHHQYLVHQCERWSGAKPAVQLDFGGGAISPKWRIRDG